MLASALIFSLTFLTITGGGNYSLVDVRNEVGLYIEQVGPLKITDSFWNLLIMKNISLVQYALQCNDVLLTNLTKLVYANEKNFVNKLNLVNEVTAHLVNLRLISGRTNRLLNNLMYETPRTERRRRGLIDGLGTVIKTITGNLDESDARRYDALINGLKQNQKSLKDILKSQVQIVNEMNSKFNKTIYQLRANEERLLQKLNEYMEHSIELEKQQFYFEVQICLERLFESYTIIENEIQTLILGVTFARLGNFYTPLIDTNILLNEFQKIPRNLVDNNLPVVPDTNNLNLLLKLCTFKSYLKNDKLVAILQIPLVKGDSYRLYHAIPFPSVLNSSSIIFPTLEYFAVSYDYTLYVSASADYLQSCKKLIDTFICLSPTIMEITLGPCEVQVTAKRRAPTCKPRKYQLQEVIYSQLKPNQWIVATPSETVLSICCDAFQEDCLQKTVSHNVKLRLSWPCFAVINGKKLQSSRSERQAVTQSIGLPLIRPVETGKMDTPFDKNIEELDDIDVSDFNKIHALVEKQKLDLAAMRSQSVDVVDCSLLITGVIVILVIIIFRKQIRLLFEAIHLRCKKRSTGNQPEAAPRSRPVNLRTMFS